VDSRTGSGQGNTLFRIAQQHGTTVTAIANANNIANVNNISVGQVLVIPGAAEGDGDASTYTVRSGDTLFRIAQQHGTTVTALVELNDIANPNQISVGQVLRIN
jgi:peptidoglycan-N-acetylglucosamine deacetylase